MAKVVKTRIQHKREFETNWLAAADFIPLEGELIVYRKEIDETTGNTLTTKKNGNEVSVLTDTGRSVPYRYDRFKLGDGSTKVNDLPFIGKHLEESLSSLQEQVDAKVQIITWEDTD